MAWFVQQTWSQWKELVCLEECQQLPIYNQPLWSSKYCFPCFSHWCVFTEQRLLWVTRLLVETQALRLRGWGLRVSKQWEGEDSWVAPALHRLVSAANIPSSTAYWAKPATHSCSPPGLNEGLYKCKGPRENDFASASIILKSSLGMCDAHACSPQYRKLRTLLHGMSWWMYWEHFSVVGLEHLS